VGSLLEVLGVIGMSLPIFLKLDSRGTRINGLSASINENPSWL
jgi:hypothetical protein